MNYVHRQCEGRADTALDSKGDRLMFYTFHEQLIVKIVFVLILLGTGCSRATPSRRMPTDLSKAYHWVSPDQDKTGGKGASGIEVSETGDGLIGKALVDDARFPAISDMSGHTRIILDSWPSGDIKVAINPTYHQTEFVGLRFTSPLTLRIENEGLILVDKAEIKVTDRAGKIWLSQVIENNQWCPLFSSDHVAQ